MKIFTLISLVVISISSFAESKDILQIIKDASEGAPPHITKNATFMKFDGNSFTSILTGSNNFTCLVVSNPQGRFEPSCFNKEAMKTIFPAYAMEMRLLYAGLRHEEVLDKISRAFANGELPNAAPGALVYMMSPNNKFYDHHHGKLGESPIHQMYFFPKLADSVFSLQSKGVTMWQGFPHLTALIVVVDD